MGKATKQGGRHGLVAMSSAAVLSIYAAGYLRTRPAAARYEQLSAARASAAPLRPGAPAAAVAAVAATPPQAVATAPWRREAAAPATAHVARAQGATAQPSPPDAPPPGDAATADAAAAAVPAPVPPALPPPAAAAAVAAGALKDGTYLGWGTSRHGDIQAEVVIAGGRIASARIARCLTAYSCSWIDPLPPQVVARQSANVDYITGATQSSDAFYGAIVAALALAQ